MSDIIWIILGVFSIILLFVFWKKRNAVWGGFTAGIILSLLVFVLFGILGKGFNWFLIIKITILGILLGFIAEILGKASDYLKK